MEETKIIREDYLSKSNPKEYEGKSYSFTLTSPSGYEAKILTYGALIRELNIADENGDVADVMLGLKGLDEYMASGSNHGSVVGRSANRIKGACFELNGTKYEIPQNDGKNNLHGGNPSYQNVFWEGKVLSNEEADAFLENSAIVGIPDAYGEGLLLSYTSPDKACGFPGNLKTEVLYAWTLDDTLLIVYKGQSDADTIFAPTNHSYFNLAGHNSGSVEESLLMINSDCVTVKDSENCPTGEIMNVEGTIFDFKEMTFLSQALNEDDPQTATSRGIDQNFCLDTEAGAYDFAACLVEPNSSRSMEVYTDMPGLQVYCGNHLGGTDQKGDIPYEQYGAVCLEAQMYPNAINIPTFASPVIKKGEIKYHVCGYKFD